MRVTIYSLLLICVLSMNRSDVTNIPTSSSYGITITNQKKINAITTLTYQDCGKMKCTRGILEYNYTDQSGISHYEKMIFDPIGYHVFDQQGTLLAYHKDNYFDFQAILNQTSQGGVLQINFYQGEFMAYGPYRIYRATNFNSPDHSAKISKQKDTYLFINTDDASAMNLNYADLYSGDGDISLSGLTFECNGLNPCIGKFLHARHISFSACTVQNARYNGHVIEFSCVQDSTIAGCTFTNTSMGYEIGGNNTNNYETIQIESASSPIACPYGKYSFYSGDYRSVNIAVTDSKFINVLRGIGNHASSNWQQCITIRNVEFNGVLEDAVHFNDETGKNNQLVLEGGIMNQIGRNQVYCSK